MQISPQSFIGLTVAFFSSSPRFELPMGTSEQPPLPQQAQNQAKVRQYIHKDPHSCQAYEEPTIYSCKVLFDVNKILTSLCLLPAAACSHHRPLLALSNPADQRQPRSTDAEPNADGRHPAKQHDGQQRASAAGPGHLLQSELPDCFKCYFV